MNTPVQQESIRRVGIVAKSTDQEGPRTAGRLGDWLATRSVDVRFDAITSRVLGVQEGFDRERLPADLDLVIVVGGDGSLLSAAHSAAPLGIPILGVNFGSLGFLTELQPDEAQAGLEAILAGRYAIEERQTLRVRHRLANGDEREFALLNDAVIAKSALARMVTIDVRVDGEEMASYASDGLIVSTPTGSTAYNLSAGGPILDPRMRAFVLAPICPHTISYRPLVVPGSVKIEASVRSPSEEVYLTLDGQIGTPFAEGDLLKIDDHPRPTRLIRVSERSFFDVLRRKLRWGTR